MAFAVTNNSDSAAFCNVFSRFLTVFSPYLTTKNSEISKISICKLMTLPFQRRKNIPSGSLWCAKAAEYNCKFFVIFQKKCVNIWHFPFRKKAPALSFRRAGVYFSITVGYYFSRMTVPSSAYSIMPSESASIFSSCS